MLELHRRRLPRVVALLGLCRPVTKTTIGLIAVVTVGRFLLQLLLIFSPLRLGFILIGFKLIGFILIGIDTTAVTIIVVTVVLRC